MSQVMSTKYNIDVLHRASASALLMAIGDEEEVHLLREVAIALHDDMCYLERYENGILSLEGIERKIEWMADQFAPIALMYRQILYLASSLSCNAKVQYSICCLTSDLEDYAASGFNWHREDEENVITSIKALVETKGLVIAGAVFEEFAQIALSLLRWFDSHQIKLDSDDDREVLLSIRKVFDKSKDNASRRLIAGISLVSYCRNLDRIKMAYERRIARQLEKEAFAQKIEIATKEAQLQKEHKKSDARSRRAAKKAATRAKHLNA